MDFVKVRDAERTAAKELFGESLAKPNDAAKNILAVRAGKPLVNGAAETNGVNGETGPGKIRTKMTEEERKKVEKMVREAKSLKEIEKLEKMLAEGRVPG